VEENGGVFFKKKLKSNKKQILWKTFKTAIEKSLNE
jgi:hypothetical protein